MKSVLCELRNSNVTNKRHITIFYFVFFMCLFYFFNKHIPHPAMILEQINEEKGSLYTKLIQNLF